MDILNNSERAGQLPACSSCNSTLDGDCLYDERSENHFCDEGCLHDWATDNFDKVLEFYYGLNIYHECV